MEINELQVGQELVQEYKGEYSVVKIDKLNPKSIVVGKKQFRKRDFYNDWRCKDGSYYSSYYTLFKKDEVSLAKVAETEQRRKEKQEKAEAERLEKERKAAEHAAFLETEEGKKWFATETFWEHTEIDIQISNWGNSREAQIRVKGNDKFLTSEFRVRQSSDYLWKEEKEIYKPCELDGYNHRFANPSQARRYTDVILKAAEIAELWNLERAGKDVPKKKGED